MRSVAISFICWGAVLHKVDRPVTGSMEYPMSISLAGEAALAALEVRNATREAALVLSRALIRKCANTIRATHRHNWSEADQLGATAARSATSLGEQLEPFPGL